jgi:hypothetical protein
MSLRRECSDNGESTGTLLGPLIAAAGLYASTCPPSSLAFASNWSMEGVLPLLDHYGLDEAQSLISSRRALVQCISLNTFILFLHMYAANNMRNWPRPDNTPHQGRRVVLFVGFSACLTAAAYALYEVLRAAGWTLLDGVYF